MESDISFLRNYLAKDLAMREDMYLFQKQGRDYKVVDKGWEHVGDQIVSSRVNAGFPYITVHDGDYLRNGELYLKHLEKVISYLHQLWRRAVH